MATTFTWTGGGADDDWSDAGNWTPSGGPPSGGDNALVKLAATINAGAGATADDVTFRDDDILLGKLETSGQLVVVADDTLTLDDHAVLQASNASASAAAVTLDNGGGLAVDDSTFDGLQGDVVVGNSGAGNLTIENGGAATLANAASSAALTIGDLANSDGAVSVTGTGSTLTMNGGLLVGDDGFGNLVISDGGQVKIDDGIAVGSQSSGYGSLIVGQSGDTSVSHLTIASGPALFGDDGVGDVTINAEGAIVDTDATSDVVIAANPGQFGILNDYGTLTAAGRLIVGEGGLGLATVEGTASAGSLVIGSLSEGAAGSVSRLTVTGADDSLTVAGTTTVGDAGDGALIVSNGASVFAQSSTLEIAAQSGSTGAVTVDDSGSLAAGALVIGGATAAAGGAGSLTVAAGGEVGAKSIRMWSGALTVDSQSLLTIGGGASTAASGVDVESGAGLAGSGDITAAITNQGVITASGGRLQLDDAVSGVGADVIDAGATLAFESSVASAQTISFAGGGGALDLIGEGTGATFSGAFKGEISGFNAAGDVIDVEGSGASGDKAVWSQVQTGPSAYGTLTVETAGGATLETLTLEGTYGQKQFTVTDPVVGDQIALTACYRRGTGILTARGEVAIEALSVGDLVVTGSGARRPVVWIGHRRIDISRHPFPAAVWPVRVAAGAFGPETPRRDLWLSPNHNIAAEGALMPISALVNGASVVQIEEDSVEYWHVELDAHDVIFADGLTAESYLDTGNRTAFVNGGAFIEAHPDFAAKHWADTCLPLVFEGEPVARTRARLIEQLAAQGDVIVRDADAHLICDGRRIEPMRLSATRLVFAPPAGGRDISLRSKTFVPAQALPESMDPRVLGLCVGRLQVDGETIALSDEGELPGWREAEREDGRFARRWTSGAAPLPAGARVVIVDLAGEGYYWGRREAAAASRRTKAA